MMEGFIFSIPLPTLLWVTGALTIGVVAYVVVIFMEDWTWR